MIITTGRDEINSTHKVDAPAEIWEAQDDNGQAIALEIIDRKGSKMIVAFKS